MRTIKKVASHIFIDGFGGMTQGLFATLIIGTMIQQIGLLIGGSGRTWRTARRFHRSFRRHHLRPSGFRQDQG